MITSKSDYLRFLEEDKKALNVKSSIKSFLFHDIWRFQRTLRRLEYLTNCRKNKILILLTKIYYKRQSVRLGFSIPINVFDSGLSIAHYGTIVVNGGARVGKNCRIHVCTNIGTSAGMSADAPTIGDNCYIAPGAKIFGKITIGDNVFIGANAVVNKDFIENNITLVGIPAKKIEKKA